MAARIVRPVNRTSSTRTTVFPLRSTGISRALDDRLLGDQREVVAVEGDVQGADGERHALVLVDRGGDPAGEGDAAALDPDEDEAVGPGLPLDDLVGDADDRPADLVRRHDLAPVHRRSVAATWHVRPPSRPLWTGR